MPYNGGLDLHLMWFSNGGCVIHKMWVEGYAGEFSAWFDAQGNLLDAQQWISFLRHRTVQRDKPCWKAIERKGRQHISNRKLADETIRTAEGNSGPRTA